MTRHIPKFIAATAVVSLILAGCAPVDRAGGTAAVQPHTLRFAISGTDDVPAAAAGWAEAVERASDGTLAIEFVTEYAAEDVHQESRVIADVRAGTIELGWVGVRVLDANGFDGFQPLLAPFLVDSYELQSRLFKDGVPAAMTAGMDRIGLQPLGVFPGPIRRIMSRDAAFTDPSAYKGARVAAFESTLSAEVFAALGARVTPMFGGQMDLSGVNAAENHPASVWGNQFQSTWRHLTGNVNFWPRPLVIIANPTVFAALTPSQQEALSSAVPTTLDAALADAKESDLEATADLCKAGVTFDKATVSQLQALETAVRPVVDKIRTDATKADPLARIEALKLRVGAPPTALTCDIKPGEQGEDSIGIPEGTYARTITAADIDKYGIDPVLKKHLAGYEFTLVFKDGIVTQYGVDAYASGASATPDQSSFTYTAYKGRIRMSGPIEIVASYAYHDGELRFTDMSFPDCDDCENPPNGLPGGYLVSFSYVPTPWVRQE